MLLGLLRATGRAERNRHDGDGGEGCSKPRRRAQIRRSEMGHAGCFPDSLMPCELHGNGVWPPANLRDDAGENSTEREPESDGFAALAGAECLEGDDGVRVLDLSLIHI